MADLFGERVPDEWIEAVFAACEKAPQHRYLFLTKNPKRYVELYEAGKLPMYENMYFGTSVTNEEDLETALGYIGELPGKTKTFLSIEPILEDISQNDFWKELIEFICIEWVIIGAETGNRRDKVVPRKEWINNIVDDCAYNDISVFMKDSLIPIVGEENMRRKFPWER